MNLKNNDENQGLYFALISIIVLVLCIIMILFSSLLDLFNENKKIKQENYIIEDKFSLINDNDELNHIKWNNALSNYSKNKKLKETVNMEYHSNEFKILNNDIINEFNFDYKSNNKLIDLYNQKNNIIQMQNIALYIIKKYKVKQIDAEQIVYETYKKSLSKKIDPLLVLSLIEVESEFQKNVESNYGALGLTQVIPSYHKEKIKIGSSITDITTNIDLGTDVYREYLNKFKGNQILALQQYNGSLKDKTNKFSNKVLSKHINLKQMLANNKSIVLVKN